jgi:hypothetical protein
MADLGSTADGRHTGGEGEPVKGLKTTFISILAIGLLAGSAVGVVAQDEEADPIAPSAFRADFAGFPGGGPPDISFDPETGLESLGIIFEATDPRASGLLTVVAARGGVVGDTLPRYAHSKEGARLVNDGGAWVGTLVNFDVEEPDERTKKQKKKGKGKAPISGGGLFELTGEGGYDGLSMVASVSNRGIVGIIIPTDTVPTQPEPPPATESEAAE